MFKWAWYRAREFRGKFWLAAAAFSFIVALIVSRVPLPLHPTADQNLIATVLAIVGATIFTTVGTYACALVAAPFEQRNVLRTFLSEARKTITELRVAPVSDAHGGRLRQIAAHLRESMEDYTPLDYGDDPITWELAFHEHFPNLRLILEKAREADTAFDALKERLQAENAKAGMASPPWTPAEYLPWLAITIQARAIQNISGSSFNFDWQELGSENVYIGDPVYANLQILEGCAPSEISLRKATFEDFFNRAESLPETAMVRLKWDERKSAERAAIDMLSTAANTDPVTSRCFLCRGEA